MVYPKNRKKADLKKWTAEEDDLILYFHLKRIPLEEQAERLKRPVKSIEFRRRWHRLSWNNQKVPVRPQNNEMEYIHEKKYKKITSYQIIKKVNGKLRNFGSYRFLSHAQAERDRLKSVNWDIERWMDIREYVPASNKVYNSHKYIYKKYNEKYMIYKQINGNFQSFGTYETIEKAIEERNLLVECNWDYDALVEIEK